MTIQNLLLTTYKHNSNILPSKIAKSVHMVAPLTLIFIEFPKSKFQFILFNYNNFNNNVILYNNNVCSALGCLAG